jgi:hypothetical protein
MVCWCDDEMHPTVMQILSPQPNRDDAGPSFSTHFKVDPILTRCLKMKLHLKYSVQANFLLLVDLL